MNYPKPFLLLCLLFGWLAACQEDPCEGVECQNGGTCIEGSCECAQGYSGPNCETANFAQYLGTYDATYGNCFATSPQHQVRVEEGMPGTGEVFLYDLGDYACPDSEFRLVGSFEGTSLTIDSQLVDCGPLVYTVFGSGAYTGNAMTISFTNIYDADGILREDNCTATLVK